MIKRFLNSKWLIIRHGVSVVVVFAVLIVALVAISPDISFGWFAQNNTVSANGMAVQAQHNEFTVYYRLPARDSNGNLILTDGEEFTWQDDDWVAFDTENLNTSLLLADINAPGDEVTFQIKVVSASAATLTGFGFAAPSGPSEEAPVMEGNTAHYLSTELHTSLLKIDNTVVSDPPEIYFRDGNGTKQINLFAGQDPIELEEGGSAIFEITVGFLNRSTSQNIFKNYASNGGVFARRFFFTFGDS